MGFVSNFSHFHNNLNCGVLNEIERMHCRVIRALVDFKE